MATSENITRTVLELKNNTPLLRSKVHYVHKHVAKDKARFQTKRQKNTNTSRTEDEKGGKHITRFIKLNFMKLSLS